jgi:NitT/TauT family transport system ATP-binding protein
LRDLTPGIPILSEESADIPYVKRAGWRRYWLVDPLDGTREFVKRNGEFTVNIALIDDGQPVLGPRDETAIVFQSPTLLPWASVLDNVLFPLRMMGRMAPASRDRARELIRLVGLEDFEAKSPRELSGGMQQRVAICRALIHEPQVLLMDEPFGALDSQTRALMQELLLEVWEQSHKTVLFVTHDIDEAIFLGDRVCVMTARPGQIKKELAIPLPRPRNPEILTSPEFIEIKRIVVGLIREEALKVIETQRTADRPHA